MQEKYSITDEPHNRNLGFAVQVALHYRWLEKLISRMITWSYISEYHAVLWHFIPHTRQTRRIIHLT